MQIDERTRNCVAFIGIENESGQFVPYGTGFLISKFYRGTQFNYIVTCNHVLDIIPGNTVALRINLYVSGSEILQYNKDRWFRKQEKDIAVLPCHLWFAKYYLMTVVIGDDFATKEKLIEFNVRPGFGTLLVGLFTSHYGDIRNEPIVRIGNIAAMPDDPLLTSAGYIKGYLVESRSIGGLSGSPVFLDMERHGFGVANYVLGMMQGYYTTQEYDVVRGDSLADAMNSGMGVVIPIEEIGDFINSPAICQLMEETMKKVTKNSGARPAMGKPIPDSENPQHKEDFNSLVSAATKKKPRDD